MSVVHSSTNRLPEDLASQSSSTEMQQQQQQPPPQQQQQFSLPVVSQDAATITLMVDSEFFDANPHLITNPLEWDEKSNLKGLCPESFPGARVFIARPHAGRNYRGQIVAVQLELKEYDAVSGTSLLQTRLSHWSEELSASADRRIPPGSVGYDRRTGRAILRPPVPSDPLARAQYVPATSAIRSSTNQRRRPTLFTLLVRLSDPSITTVEQRFAIRHIITDYLNNEISNGKVFSYLGQVIGYQSLDDVIKSLPSESSSAMTVGYIKIEQSMQLQHPITTINDTVVTGIQRHQGPKFTPSVLHEDGDDLQSDIVRHNKALLFRSFVKPLRWLYPESCQFKSLISFGQRTIMLDRRAFILGGAPKFHSGRSLTGRCQSTLPEPTFESIQVIDLLSLESKCMKPVSLEFCPRSMVGHTCHLCQIITGPLSIIHGGLICHPSRNMVEGSKVLSPSILQTSRKDSDGSHEIQLNSSLYGLDIVARRWMNLDSSSKLKPPPRHSHASAVYPHSAEVVSGSAAPFAQYFIIFGGIGSSKWKLLNEDEKLMKSHSCQLKDLIVMNDLWVFSFEIGQWLEIELSLNTICPSPRYGISLTWISVNALVLYGGEGRNSILSKDYQGDLVLGLPLGEREILSDSWILNFKDTRNGKEKGASMSDISDIVASDLEFTWFQSPSIAPPRAHYAAVGLTACLPPATVATSQPSKNGAKKICSNIQGAVWSSSVESAMKDLKSLGWTTQRVIILISGTTKNADGVIYETPTLLLGLVFPKLTCDSSYMIVWKCLEDIPLGLGHLGPSFKGRRNHTAMYFDALAELPAEQMMAEELKRYKMKMKKNNDEKDQQIENEEDIDFEYLYDSVKNSPYKPFGKTPTCVPCILVIGGMNGSTRQLVEDVWILKLSKLLPKFMGSDNRQRMIERRLLMGLLLSGVRCTPSFKKVLKIEDDDDDEEWLDRSLGDNEGTIKKGYDLEELKIMKTVWDDPLHNYQPGLYHIGIAATSGLLWSLATIVKHPLTPFGNLYDNAIQRHVHAKSISICFEKWYRHDAISITDDGYGLSHKGLHILLKRFGHASNDLSKRHADQNGLGFKLAIGRLAYNAIVITKTVSMYGVGLFSSPLNAFMGTTNFACPVACWSTVDGFPIALPSEEAEFGQTVGMIVRNSPLGTSANLEREFQRFGKSTGTRIIMFGLRRDLPYFHFTNDYQLTFNSWRSSYQFEIPTVESIRARPFLKTDTDDTKVDDEGLKSNFEKEKIKKQKIEDSNEKGTENQCDEKIDNMEVDVPMPDVSTTAEVNIPEDTEGDICKDLSMTQSVQQENALGDNIRIDSRKEKSGTKKSSTMITLPNGLSDFPIELIYPVKLPETFPLWNSAVDSLDYNLATYLYWSQLHSGATLYLNGIELKPRMMQIKENGTMNNAVDGTVLKSSAQYPESPGILKSLKETLGIELPSVDRYSCSLYRYLQQRLYYKLELPFLFEPKFGEDNFYGIVGFLNDDLSSKPKAKKASRVCETGVLLYYKSRLINRAMLKIPVVPDFLQPSPSKGRLPETTNVLSELALTAVINVPDFLFPRATKEEFITESDIAFHDFYDRLEETLKEYLNVYWDSDKLKDLQLRYVKEYDAYRERRWSERRRVRLEDLENDDHEHPAKYQAVCGSSESDDEGFRKSPNSQENNNFNDALDSPKQDRKRRTHWMPLGTRQRDRRTGRYK